MTRNSQPAVSRRTGLGVHAPPPTPPRPDAISGQTLGIDLNRLAAALRSRLRGEVRFDDGDRALYSTDASNYRQIPIGVVVPRDACAGVPLGYEDQVIEHTIKMLASVTTTERLVEAWRATA